VRDGSGLDGKALRQWRQKSQPEALGELLKAYRQRAYALALRMTNSASDAEDVVQESFIRLFRFPQGLDNRRRLNAV